MHASIYMKMGKRAHLERQKVAEGLPGAGESGEWRVTANGYGASF